MNIRLGKYSNILYLLLSCGLVNVFLIQIPQCAFISLCPSWGETHKGTALAFLLLPCCTRTTINLWPSSFEWSPPKAARSVSNVLGFNLKIGLFTECSSSENYCTYSWKFKTWIFLRFCRNISSKPFLICRGRLDSWTAKVILLLLVLTVSNTY